MFKSKKKQEKKKAVEKPKVKLKFVKVEYDAKELKIVEIPKEKPELVKIRYIGPNPLPYKYLDGTMFYPIGEVDPTVAESLLKNPRRWEKVDY